ncbi:proteasome activator [Actinomycetospora chibensis]|uniref:Bacterial proteasome activator n=1 Tax=Actinomycetospora chibensis TaxID=663606 RepID=A0ABV9RP27_9PSEU|nr:proteasome activator [Actinomycetospora chibensis]MDD7922232.1 DUF2587 domain-containing protein [Actinomycetospora chibensis]
MPAWSPDSDSEEPAATTAAASGTTVGPVVHDARKWSRVGGPAVSVPSPRPEAAPATEPPGDVEEGTDPGAILRIGTMIRRVLEEVRDAPMDDPAREQLREIRRRAVDELTAHLGPELRQELEALVVPLPADEVLGDVQLRMAQAQLVGWIEGLFQGAQMAFAAEQVAARSQLERLRHEATQGRRDTPPGSAGQYL